MGHVVEPREVLAPGEPQTLPDGPHVLPVLRARVRADEGDVEGATLDMPALTAPGVGDDVARRRPPLGVEGVLLGTGPPGRDDLEVVPVLRRGLGQELLGERPGVRRQGIQGGAHGLRQRARGALLQELGDREVYDQEHQAHAAHDVERVGDRVGWLGDF